MNLSVRSHAGQADYKTDYILAGRVWTTLDVLGRPWTTLDDPGRCVAKNRQFKGNVDKFGRGWTACRVLRNRWAQVRSLSHLPLGNTEMKRLKANTRRSHFCLIKDLTQRGSFLRQPMEARIMLEAHSLYVFGRCAIDRKV
jgi:hypothetical protein